MYTIKIKTHFSSAHFLREYKGKCENLHGHNWQVETIVERFELDRLGMVMDFGNLKSLVSQVMESLDHCTINDIEYFKQHNPSSENIACYIFEQLKNKIVEAGCRLVEVRVWETDNSCAFYSEAGS